METSWKPQYLPVCTVFTRVLSVITRIYPYLPVLPVCSTPLGSPTGLQKQLYSTAEYVLGVHRGGVYRGGVWGPGGYREG